MLVSAGKLAFLGLAGVLTFSSFPCFAGDAVLSADRIGLGDAVALNDREMGDLRGTGFLGALTQGLLGTLTPTARTALANGSQSTLNALTGFIPTLLSVLPPGNTVSAQIGTGPPVTQNGTGPQSLGCGNGITCGPGTSVSLSSSNNPASASASISFTLH
ncbi:hypothetical protein [Hypericibacter sp.]|uniref:hypothetical protein n=1 Tax=Hypericibacter sp. TaxID=2705401 RepID=UPI003D6CD717